MNQIELSARHTKLFKIFKGAIANEQNAQSTYRQALAVCDDPELAKILRNFESEEKHHEAVLVEAYKLYRTHLVEGDPNGKGKFAASNLPRITLQPIRA